jgi:deoxyhypusine synthase
MSSPVRDFIQHHYRHFNSAALVDAAKAYEAHLAKGGKMFMTLAGAMSTAELGLSLAEMIRQDKVHAICCTGANLEEDVFNLVAHDYYERVPHYRDLTPADEQRLLDRHMNRVTDTCIPEMEAMRRIETAVLEEWVRADKAGERWFPHQFMYKILESGVLKKEYQIDPKNSWLLAAMEKKLPMFVPGWEDATLGNMYAGHCISGDVKKVHTVRTGIEYMIELAEWYTKTTETSSIGFFQIGGGIAGDFPSASCQCSTRICSVSTCRSGATSARSATRPRASAPTRVRCRTKKSPGASSASTRPSTSSNRTPPSSPR